MSNTELKTLLKQVQSRPSSKKTEIYQTVLELALIQPDPSIYAPELHEIQDFLKTP